MSIINYHEDFKCTECKTHRVMPGPQEVLDYYNADNYYINLQLISYYY